MFVLATIEDTLFLPASSLTAPSSSSSSSANASSSSKTDSASSSSYAPTTYSSLCLSLNTKYSNRIVPEVGLCITLFDVLSVSEGRVKWGDGGLWHTVKARMVVFRPFMGEILLGKVMSADEGGMRVSMGFFDDVHIPPHLMPEPSAFDHQDRAWFCLFNPSDDSYYSDPLAAPPEERMYLDRDESIRFMVEDDVFDEMEPLPGLGSTSGAVGKGAGQVGHAGGAAIPASTEQGQGQSGTSGLSGNAAQKNNATVSAAAAMAVAGSKTSTSNTSSSIGSGITLEAIEAARAKRKAPFRITASIANQGLGLVRWWTGASEHVPDEDDGGGEQDVGQEVDMVQE